MLSSNNKLKKILNDGFVVHKSLLDKKTLLKAKSLAEKEYQELDYKIAHGELSEEEERNYRDGQLPLSSHEEINDLFASEISSKLYVIYGANENTIKSAYSCVRRVGVRSSVNGGEAWSAFGF